jgi:ubiquinone/menaquinone biosynthesis C-methylase UbiE
MEPYEYDTMRSVEDTYWWYTGLHELAAKNIQQALQDSPNLKVLDAGCGTGGMMEKLHQVLPNAELIGIDFNSSAVEFTKQRNIGTVKQASVEKLPFPNQFFDQVVSLDVVCSEGIDDAQAFVEFHRVLKSGGALFVNLAAFGFLKGEHSLAGHEERRYTKQKLYKLLTNAGFVVERMTYWNTTLFPIMVLWRPLSLMLANKQAPRSDLKPLPSFVNQALKWLILQEIQLTQYLCLPFGSSVFAIARKAETDDQILP